MSKVLRSKTFKKVIKIAVVGALLYAGGSAIASGMSAGAGAASSGSSAAAAGGLAPTPALGAGTVNTGVAAGAVSGAGSGMAASTVPTMATTGLSAGAGGSAGSGYISGFLGNPLVQAGMLQTGGALLQGALADPPIDQRKQYQDQGPLAGVTPTYESYSSYAQPQGQSSNRSGMPVYNQQTKRWEPS